MTNTDLRVMIGGRKWRLLYAEGMLERYGTYGDRDPPNKTGKAIRLDPDQTDEELLDTLLHEMSHAVWPDLSESAVMRIASDYTAAILALFKVRRRCESELSGTSTSPSSTPATSTSAATCSDSGESTTST